MEIFYIKKSELLEKINQKDLENLSDGKKYNSTEKCIEHLCGLYLVKYIAEKFYNLDNLEIEVINSKPFFKSRKIYFSLSHSKDVIGVAFDESNVGLDIEYITTRNFKKLLTRFNIKIENPTETDFYTFWTLFEAKYKLGENYISKYTTKIENEYMLSCVSIKDNITPKIIHIDL